MLRKFCTCQSHDILQLRLSTLAAPCLSSFHTVRSIMVTIKLRIKCKRRNNIARDSFPWRRIELELNKQSPFAVALIAEKHSPLTWLTFAVIKHVAKSSRGRFWRIRSLAVLISFLNMSSFLVNILFAFAKKNIKSGYGHLHTLWSKDKYFYRNRKLETKIS